MSNKSNNTDPTPPKKKWDSALRFVTIGWQMIATVLFCVGIGWLFDEKWVPTAKPWGMLGFTLFGVIASMVLVIREVTRISK